MEVRIEIGSEFRRQFKRLAKKYRSLVDDLDEWKKEIYNNPLCGDDLGGGVRKIRWLSIPKVREKAVVHVY